MTIVHERTPLELPSGQTVKPERPLGVFTRPTETEGWKSWFTTVDHKKIGIMYGVASLTFFLVAGFEALLIRTQLAVPGNDLLSADLYNQVFTMHAITMVFLVVMPLQSAFANYLLPLQIGARDVAFPRMNALSLWVWLLGAIFFNTSWLFGGGANGGWFAYAPNSGVSFTPGHGMDFYAVGLIIMGIGSTVSAINLTVTVFNMRTPGMTMMKMPVFTWMAFITQVLLVFALPVITVALFLLMFDRLFDANFFNVAKGGDPFLWEHLFWIFGHPEVYIMLLPAMGMTSDMLACMSRKPIFGYKPMVYSMAAIAGLGFIVWGHHMFTSGMNPALGMTFMVSTMMIALPSAVKVFNWIGTMWGGRLQFNTVMLNAIAFVSMFIVGGLSGIFMAAVPVDIYIHDTYFIVAHFHYVLFGATLFGVFGAIHFWFPKMFGRTMNEGIGKLHFALTFIGMNGTFFPMHLLGVAGMPRRYADPYLHPYLEHLLPMNQFMTICAILMGFAQILLLVNFFVSIFAGKECGDNPWLANGLEWSAPSPPPHGNFPSVPIVYRGPYEYSNPDQPEGLDYWPQTEPPVPKPVTSP
ncbi:MAG: cytochrome c oxidase subunit I, partial [Microthrixaceae bacterium]|nr:cytochrome c oxidase subunit I [Microthrixaceae bacterium]